MHYSNITPEEYLVKKGIEYKTLGDELEFSCPFAGCDEDRRDNENYHCSVNAESGLYHCKKCNSRGNMATLAKHLGDTVGDVVQKKEAIQKPKKKFNPALVDICHKKLTLEDRKYLNERGQSNEIIDKEKYGRWESSNGEIRISIPLKDEKGEYIGLKLRKDPHSCVENENNKYIYYPSGIETTIYNAEKLKDAKDKVFLAEGEFDAKILESKGLVAVSNPGAGIFKDEWVEKFFKNIKEVYICFDNDVPGKTGAIMVAKKLSRISGIKIYIVTLPEKIKSGKKGDITDYFVEFNGTVEELLSWAKPFNKEKSDGNEEEEEEEKENKQVAILRKNILDEDNIFHFLDQFKEAHVWVKVDNHHEVMRCEADRFKRWLHKKYFEITNDSPSSESLKKFTELIIALATFGKEKRELSVRIAKDGNVIWYDLGDYEWRAVRIDENGWRIVDNPPILFKRSVQDEQVLPEKGGNVKRLLDFVNIKETKQGVLFLISVIVNFFPHLIRPLHVFYGSQGSAKSTASQAIKSITDPAGTELLVLVGDQRELSQQLSHHYLLAFDNLSGLSSGVSDILCKAVTGAGLTKRKLYSDDENIQFKFKRALTLNGVNLVVIKPDLLDRSLLFQFERIGDEERKSDEQFWEEFNAEKGKLLGAIFDVMSQAMKILPTIKLDKSPRMADFTRYGCAVAEVLGYGKELFLEAYDENRNIQNQQAIEENPIAAAISVWINQMMTGSWIGTSTELLRDLHKTAENEGIDVKSRKWPKDASALSRRINEVKVNLLLEGIQIEKMGQREWQIQHIEKCRQYRNGDEGGLNEASNNNGNPNGIEKGKDIINELPF